MTTTPEYPILDLTAIGRLGEALALLGEEHVFVFGGIPGEQVEVEVLRRRRKYLAARVRKALNPSPDRTEPPCPYFGECTGCQWQHISYRHQLVLKKMAVQDALSRIGGLEDAPVLDVLPAPEQFGYRNHARFTIGPEGALGFVHRETRRFVRIERCMLMHPQINQVLSQLQGKCAETTQLSVRYGINTGDYLVQPRLKNPELKLETGQTHYSESLLGNLFRVASPSFFQVNTRQAERIAGLVRDGLGLDGSGTLVDAYAGVGTFAVLMSPFVGQVIAIEDSSAAVEDAGANTKASPNVRFMLGKTEDVLGQLEERPDAVIMDPPRKGCHPQALEALKKSAPARVAYVSCDPTTLAMDMKELCDGTFRLVSVQPVDMFPQTHHLECVAILAAM